MCLFWWLHFTPPFTTFLIWLLDSLYKKYAMSYETVIIMSRTIAEMIESLENRMDLYHSSADDPAEDVHVKRIKECLKSMRKAYGQSYVEKFRDIRQAEAEDKVVTSVAIHGHNRHFIEQLQSEAKAQYFTLSKENIINIALACLEDCYVDNECDVEKLVDSFV